MLNECPTPSRVPKFSDYLNSEKVDDLETDPPKSCNADLKDPEKTSCASFTSWSNYTASMCGALGMAAQIVDKTVSNKKIASEIVSAIRTVYDGIAGVNSQFLEAIVDINAKKPYSPLPTPEPVPPFPVPSNGSDVEQAVVEGWNMLKPWIEEGISKMPTGSPWIKVLEGIIVASDNMIKDLQDLFKEIAGTPVA